MYDEKGNLKDLYTRIFATEIIYQPEKFMVFTYEASSGKTTTIVNALKDLYKINPNHKTLIVTKLMKEQEILKEGLGGIAMVDNTENKKKKEILCQVPVLIITHEKYRRLCSDYDERQYYIKGRDTLIIDEQLDVLVVDEFATTRAEEVQEELKNITLYDEDKNQIDLAENWGEMVEGLYKAIPSAYSNKKMKFTYIENDKIEKQLEVLTKRIKASGVSEKKKKELIKSIGFCKYFYNNEEVIAKDAKLLTYNKAIDYFTLKNNILLDASGKFLELYKISDKFIVKDFDRTILHSNTELIFINQNSTTSHITKNPKSYFDDLTRYIRKNTVDGDKVLIVGRETIRVDNKDIATTELLSGLSNDIDFDFVNFMAMRGKNDWRDYNKCFVIHFPNNLFHNYIFQYLQYRKITKLPLTNDDLIINKVKGSLHHGFCNNENLESLRITDVVSNIYQALKRVNRVNTANNSSTFYVITNDDRVQNLLIEQFKGLKNIQYHRMSEVTQTRTLERSQDVNEYFTSMEIGSKIKKIELRKAINLIDRKKFSRALEELGGDEYLQLIGIKENGHFYLKIA